MNEDATQGNWQPLADQPILPDSPAPTHRSDATDHVVWAKPPDVAAPVAPDAAPPEPSDFAPPTPSDIPPPSTPQAYAGPSGYSPTADPPTGFRDGPAPDYLESAPSRRVPLAGVVGLVIIGVLILAGLGFAVRGGSTSTSATSTGTIASRSAAPATGALDSYLLSPADVGAGTRMTLVPDGRSLSGANGATLDFCDRNFASEKSRMQRVQAQYDGPAGTASNEFVRYRPGGAQEAFAEVTKAVSTCGSGYQNGSGTVSHIQQLSGFAGLTSHNVVVSFEQQTSNPGATQSFWVTCAYQFDGDYFSGVYVYSATPAAGRELAAALAKKAAGHLEEATGGAPGTGGGPLSSSSPGGGAPGLAA